VIPNGGAHVEEFKTFALRGNVVDLATGEVIGAAFEAIVASVLAAINMPIIVALTGGLDFSNYNHPRWGRVYPPRWHTGPRRREGRL
jgi:large conductance mechanosensitive channel